MTLDEGWYSSDGGGIEGERMVSSSQYEAGGRRSVRFGPKSWQDTPKSARFGLSSAGLFGHEVHIENCWRMV